MPEEYVYDESEYPRYGSRKEWVVKNGVNFLRNVKIRLPLCGVSGRYLNRQDLGFLENEKKKVKDELK